MIQRAAHSHFRLDPDHGLPQANSLRELVVKRRLDRAVSYVQTLRVGRWDERARYAAVVGDEAGLDAVEAYALANADSAAAWEILGVVAQRWASETRGSGLGHEVDRSLWPLITERGEWARDCLLRASALDPENPNPWIELLGSCLMLGAEIEDRLGCFREAMRLDPRNRSAIFRALDAVSMKWSGSHELMFKVAREHVASLPANDDGRLAIVTAHELRAEWVGRFQDDPSGRADYLRNPAVLAEVDAAYEATVGASTYKSHAFSKEAHSLAASWFFLIGDAPRLRLALEKLDGVLLPSSWQLVGDPGRVFEAAHQNAGFVR